MGEAFLWGALGGAALLLGAAGAVLLDVSQRAIGMVMAFGSGALISAMAYELIAESYRTSEGQGGIAAGFVTGAIVFFAGDLLIDRMGGEERKSVTGKQAGGSGLAIVFGSILDGVPESIVLGLGLTGGSSISVAMIAAVFISNLPEGLAATSGLVASGWSTSRVLRLWAAVTLVAGLSALVGYTALDDAAGSTIAFVLAFAGGAILTMLADTMMPEAYEHGGKLVGLFTAAGFGLAFALTTLD